MLQKVFLLFLLVLNVECIEIGRRGAGTLRKDTGVWKRGRGDVFENLFNLYDPTFLSTVWPKITNGMHLALETPCWDDVSVFFKDLAEGRAWAYNAVDASGRYQGALFAGSRFWLGSKEECTELDNRFTENIDKETLALLRNNEYLNTILRKQKYFDAETNDWRWALQQDELIERLVIADRRPPYKVAYTVLQVRLNITKITMNKSYDVMLGVCLPQTCPEEDVESIINFSIMLNDNLRSNKTVPRIVKIVSSRRINAEFDLGSDIGAILLLTVTVLLATVVTIATLLDFDLLKFVPYKKQSMSFDLPTSSNSETHLVDELRRKHKEIKTVDDILVESANMNFGSMSKMPKSVAACPPITLDVVNVDRMSGSCNRCGKYKRQCPNSRHVDNLAACPRVRYSSFASLSTADKRKKHFLCRLLLCFSISYSWKRIFNKNTANKDLSSIHVVRILATFWIIFVHVAVIAGYNSVNAGDINERNNLYYILATGTIAFDILFFVSGLFSSHHFFYLKSRYSVEELVSFSGVCGQLMQFICFVTNRIIRLLPSYAYTVLLAAVVARVSRNRSALVLPDGDHRNCDENWWRNLLYITNLYPNDEQCMQVSWYLSTETQLHALGALACATSMSASMRARFVVAIVAALVLAATAADVSSAYVDNDMKYASVFAAYGVMVSRGWARVAPYFGGVLAGWLAHALHGALDLTTGMRWCAWAATVPLVVAGALLPWAAAWWHSSWLHLAWACALLWPTLVSTTCSTWLRGTLCSGGAALSRLCYGMLLLHGVAARLLLTSFDDALCSNTVCIWMYFAGTTVVSLAGALLLSLLIEMPCCSLFRSLSDCATT